MTGARVLSGSAGLLAILVLLVAALAGGPSPQEEQQGQPSQQSTGAGIRQDRPIPMPMNLVGLEISLGLTDEEPTPWGGSVQVSEGRLLSLQVVGGGANAKVNGSRFNTMDQGARRARGKDHGQEAGPFKGGQRCADSSFHLP